MLGFSHLKVSYKLFIGFGVLFALILTTGIFGRYSNARLNDEIDLVHGTRLPALSYLLEADRDLQQLLVAERTMISCDPSSAVFQSSMSDFAENRGQAEARWEKYKTHATTAAELELIPQFEAARATWNKTADRFLQLVQGGSESDTNAAFDLSINENSQNFENMRSFIDAITGEIDEVAASDRERAEAAEAKLMLMNLICMIVGGVIAVSLGILVSRSITKPLARFRDCLGGLSSGDLTVRMQSNSRDDFGLLATSFNDSVSDLRALVCEVAQACEEVAEASSDIASSATEISGSVREQNEATERAASAITEMSASVEDVANQNAAAVRATQAAGEHSKHGQAIVSNTIGNIQEIDQIVRSASSALEALGDRTAAVGQIMDVIRDIADQTNLLALNAAIEAARAGEHGKGFAVVADEVRKLAERTTNATKEVTESITAIQEETSVAIERMDGGVSIVAKGVENGQKAGSALQDISGSTFEIQEQITAIAAATEQQSAASCEISEMVNTINVLIRETSKQTDQAAASSEQLLSRADHLRSMISQFQT
ncbi:MAG: methyl-accepting chemotaxis protein [Phycisphaerales bacterium]|nr:methyl-accepting chemotaxis protein [Phycisphaerales bacterium]